MRKAPGGFFRAVCNTSSLSPALSSRSVEKTETEQYNKYRNKRRWKQNLWTVTEKEWT